MIAFIPAFLFGVIFALGLGIGGMTQPENVIGFLNVTGPWNPALIWVMVGGISVHMITYRLVIRRRHPILSDIFKLPVNRQIDWKLLSGSAMFGAGWGLAGYCPAPAIVSLVTLQSTALWFTGAMISGMVLYRVLHARSIFAEGGAPWKLKLSLSRKLAR